MWRMPWIKRIQRPYVRSHPIAIWVALGAFIAGLVALVFPATVAQSSITLLLPDWLEHVYQVMIGVGGFLAFIGIARAKPNIESAGWGLIGSAFVADFASIFLIRPELSWGVLFILLMGIGCLERSQYLVEVGQSNGDGT